MQPCLPFSLSYLSDQKCQIQLWQHSIPPPPVRTPGMAPVLPLDPHNSAAHFTGGTPLFQFQKKKNLCSDRSAQAISAPGVSLCFFFFHWDNSNIPPTTHSALLSRMVRENSMYESLCYVWQQWLWSHMSTWYMKQSKVTSCSSIEE